MSLGFDWSLWVSVITGALIIGTVWVGIRGLFSDDHVKDGKLTRSGKWTAGLMAGLGLLTFFSGYLSQRLADEKERQEAAEREERFQRQMNSLSRLQTDMQHSLREQGRLFGKADENLRMSGALQEQAQGNTLSVLQRVFEESNRIAAERIAIGVTYQCPPQDRFRDNPRILEATLMVRDSDDRAVRFVTRQVTAVGDGLVFHGFLGDLGRFETFPAWRRARISIRLSGGDISFGGMSLLEYSQLTDEELRRRENPDPVSCPTRAMLFLNGRQVLTASAAFTRLNARRDYAADFDNLRVEPHRLPRFSN